jgi:3-oxoadipate enol-lactonase
MAELAGDVVDLLDGLHIPQAAVVGCSMGGYVLFELLRTAPQYIGAVGLVSTRPGADSAEGRTNREKMIETVDREGVEAVAAQMVPKLIGASTGRDRPDVVKHVRNLVVTNSRGGVRAAVAAMRDRIDSTPVLGRIGVPAIVVHGGEDTLIPPAEGEAMQRAIATARLEIMGDCGHLPNIEQPRAFAGVLWQFLDAL